MQMKIEQTHQGVFVTASGDNCGALDIIAGEWHTFVVIPCSVIGISCRFFPGAGTNLRWLAYDVAEKHGFELV